MKYSVILIIRWFVWLLLVSFESIVGFPWLSMLLAGEWVFSFASYTAIASLFMLSLILASAYSLVWPVAMFLMIIIWQISVQTRKKSWWRWGLYLGTTMAVGIIRHIPLNPLSIFFTLLSLTIFLRFLGVKFLSKLWKKPLLPSVKL